MSMISSFSEATTSTSLAKNSKNPDRRIFKSRLYKRFTHTGAKRKLIFRPSKEDPKKYIETKEYPFTRKIYLLNYQGRTGLGMGFASYLAGETGQRIILKSGLSPKRFPSREIDVRGKIE